MKYIITFLLIFITGNAFAEMYAKPGPMDSRVKTIVYNERDVVRIIGHYGFTTAIEFSTNESIENISVGDSIAWQIIPNSRANILFVKPVEENAATNMTVVTSYLVGDTHIKNRIYNFSLDAKQKDQHTSSAFTWYLKFQYQEGDHNGLINISPKYLKDIEASNANRRRSVFGEDLNRLRDNLSVTKDSFNLNPNVINYSYSFAGDSSQVPLRIFDNGEFTFFKFNDSVEKPAIFSVDKNQNESLVNASRHGEYYVVHRIGRQYTLRNGDLVTCIFNEQLPVQNETVVPHKDDYQEPVEPLEVSLRDQ